MHNSKRKALASVGFDCSDLVDHRPSPPGNSVVAEGDGGASGLFLSHATASSTPLFSLRIMQPLPVCRIARPLDCDGVGEIGG
jgi:hypothetical protein